MSTIASPVITAPAWRRLAFPIVAAAAAVVFGAQDPDRAAGAATTNGSRVVTRHRFYAKDREEEWQADAARLDVDPADLEIEYGLRPTNR